MAITANTSRLKSDFLHSIKLGTGRAILLAQANPEVDFSPQIIKAMLKNFSYDGQSESSRAPYLYELYCLSAQPARIRRAVLKGLATEQRDTWTLTQLFKLALLFARQGDVKARRAIYHRFLNHPIDGSDWAGSDEIMKLDGLEGLFYIVRKFGRALAKDPDDWQDGSVVYSFQKKCPAIDAWAELRQLAEQDEDVRRYLQYVEASRTNQATYERPPVPTDLEELLRRRRPHRFFLRSALKKRGLEPHEIHQLAERLLTEQNPWVRENLLNVFTVFKFPLACQPILALARQKPRPQSRLTEFALGALQYLAAPEIREFALQKLPTTTWPASYTNLLVSNYQAGDAALLTALVGRFHNEHIIESLAISYTKIYQANPTPECAAPLLALYHKSNCGMERHEVVKLLLENSVLPAWVNEEIAFDSDAETRLLHQAQE